jgi:hypothetical protein
MLNRRDVFAAGIAFPMATHALNVGVSFRSLNCRNEVVS